MSFTGKILMLILWIGILAGPIATSYLSSTGMEQKKQAWEEPVEEEGEEETEKKEKDPELLFDIEKNQDFRLRGLVAYHFHDTLLTVPLISIISPPPQS